MRWFALSKARIISSFRSKSTLFWSIFFPVLMLFIMISIFGGVQNTTSNLVFTFGIIQESSGMWSKIIHNVLEKLGQNSNFNFIQYKSTSNAIKALKEDKIQCLITIPRDYDKYFLTNTKSIIIEYNGERTESRIAKYIVSSIITGLNIKSAEYMGKKISIPKNKIVNLKNEISTKSSFNMADYFFAGIMIMAVLSLGSFNVPISLTWEKQKGISKRFFVTPLKSFEILLSVIVEFLFIVFVQYILLAILSVYIFHGTLEKIIAPTVFEYILFTSMLSISMGFFIASISKSPGSANAIGNIIFFPFQFLGGLYFPVLNVTPIIRWVVLSNPITYIACGLRASIGITPNPFSMQKTLLIPLLWFLFFSISGILFYKNRSENL